MGAIDSVVPRPLEPDLATTRINGIARRGYTFCWDDEVKQKLKDKDLVIGDLHYILRHGKVYEQGRSCTTVLFFKYIVETRTPNWINKSLRIVVILGNTDELRVCDVLD